VYDIHGQDLSPGYREKDLHLPEFRLGSQIWKYNYNTNALAQKLAPAWGFISPTDANVQLSHVKRWNPCKSRIGTFIDARQISENSQALLYPPNSSA
jgi:hypothetical protein